MSDNTAVHPRWERDLRQATIIGALVVVVLLTDTPRPAVDEPSPRETSKRCSPRALRAARRTARRHRLAPAPVRPALIASGIGHPTAAAARFTNSDLDGWRLMAGTAALASIVFGAS